MGTKKLFGAFATLFSFIACFVLICVFATPLMNKDTDDITDEQDIIAANCIHDYGVWSVSKEATCAELGEEKRVCTKCNYAETKEIAKLDHNYEEISRYEPSCYEIGTLQIQCKSCKEFFMIELPITHNFETIPSKSATCTEDGYTEYQKCSCGYIENKEILSATGHTPTTKNGYSPSCVATGLTDGIYCSVCDFILVEQEEIPTLGHTEIDIEAKSPSCTETGLTVGKKCSECGVITLEQEIIEMVPHSCEKIEARDPTCTVDGYTEHKKCSCGYTENKILISAYGHTPTDTWEQYTGQSLWYKKCIVCNEVAIESSNPTFTGYVIISSAYMQKPDGGYAYGEVGSIIEGDRSFDITPSDIVTVKIQATKTSTGYVSLTISEPENCYAKLEVYNLSEGVYMLSIWGATNDASVIVTIKTN